MSDHQAMREKYLTKAELSEHAQLAWIHDPFAFRTHKVKYCLGAITGVPLVVAIIGFVGSGGSLTAGPASLWFLTVVTLLCCTVLALAVAAGIDGYRLKRGERREVALTLEAARRAGQEAASHRVERDSPGDSRSERSKRWGWYNDGGPHPGLGPGDYARAGEWGMSPDEYTANVIENDRG